MTHNIFSLVFILYLLLIIIYLFIILLTVYIKFWWWCVKAVRPNPKRHRGYYVGGVFVEYVLNSYRYGCFVPNLIAQIIPHLFS